MAQPRIQTMDTPSPKKALTSPPRLRPTTRGRHTELTLSPESSPKPAKRSASEMEASENTCVECDEDLGRDNPRQLCGKTRCLKPRSLRAPKPSPSDDDEATIEEEYNEWSASLEAYREFRTKFDQWDKLTQFFVLRDLCNDEGGITRLI